MNRGVALADGGMLSGHEEGTMGSRYILTVTCPQCGFTDDDVPYAPTSGFLDWKCRCGHVVDLEAYSGIDAEATATTSAGVQAMRRQKRDTRRE